MLFRYRVIKYLIGRLSYMVNSREEGSGEAVLLASVRTSLKVTIYYINRALLMLNRTPLLYVLHLHMIYK